MALNCQGIAVEFFLNNWVNRLHGIRAGSEANRGRCSTILDGPPSPSHPTRGGDWYLSLSVRMCTQ
jgi:hypothetical protein